MLGDQPVSQSGVLRSPGCLVLLADADRRDARPPAGSAWGFSGQRRIKGEQFGLK
jgi:hypothetical protein